MIIAFTLLAGHASAERIELSYVANLDANITYSGDTVNWFVPSSNYEVQINDPDDAVGHRFSVDTVPEGFIVTDASLSFGLGSVNATFPPESRRSIASVRLTSGPTDWPALNPASVTAGEAPMEARDPFGLLEVPLDAATVEQAISQAQLYGQNLQAITRDINDVSFGVKTLATNLTPGGFFYRPEHAATLTVVLDRLGDFDRDGFVGQSDLDLVLLNWGSHELPPEWTSDDQRTGLFIGQADLDRVLLNWGSGTLSGVALIPEPAALSMLSLAWLIASRRRRAWPITCPGGA